MGVPWLSEDASAEEGSEPDADAAFEAEEAAKLKEQNELIKYDEATKTFKRFRPDFKCGSRVPLLPDEEQVECERASSSPCCSSLGWCGKSRNHCRCPTCIDY